MSKHTPGPWEAELREGEYLISGKTDGHKHFTAIVQDEDNARLIAAAPEMLEALKAIANLSVEVPNDPILAMRAAGEWIDKARSLANKSISKAESA